MIEGILYVFLSGPALFYGKVNENLTEFQPLYIEESNIKIEKRKKITVRTTSKETLFGEELFLEKNFVRLKAQNREILIPRERIKKIEIKTKSSQAGKARGVFRTTGKWEAFYFISLRKPQKLKSELRLTLPQFLVQKLMEDRIKLIAVVEENTSYLPHIYRGLSTKALSTKPKENAPSIGIKLGGFSFIYDKPSEYIKGYEETEKNGIRQSTIYLSLPESKIKTHLIYYASNISPIPKRKLIIENNNRFPLPGGTLTIISKYNAYIKELPLTEIGKNTTINLGKAMDLVFECVKISEKKNKNRLQQEWKIHLKNNSDKNIPFEYYHNFIYPNWKTNLKNYTRINSTTIKLLFNLKPEEEKTLIYRSWEWKEK